jgi:hypothetical protein
MPLLAPVTSASLAGRALDGGEFAEAGQSHLVAAGDLLRDLLQRRLDGLLRLAVVQAAALRDSAYELILVDDSHVASV